MTTDIYGCRDENGDIVFDDSEGTGTACNGYYPTCVDGNGELWAYVADCDGVGESDGWYQACQKLVDEVPRLVISIPSDCCCGNCVIGTPQPTYTATYRERTYTLEHVTGCLWRDIVTCGIHPGCPDCSAELEYVLDKFEGWCFELRIYDIFLVFIDPDWVVRYVPFRAVIPIAEFDCDNGGTFVAHILSHAVIDPEGDCSYESAEILISEEAELTVP